MASLFRFRQSGDKVTCFEDLVGHRFSYKEDIYENIFSVERGEGGLPLVVETRRVPAGDSETKSPLDKDGKISPDAPNPFAPAGTIFNPGEGVPYNGHSHRLWLPPDKRKQGEAIHFAGMPSPFQNLGMAHWRGLKVWAMEYGSMIGRLNAFYDPSSGVLLGNTGFGTLTRTSLKIRLPKS